MAGINPSPLNGNGQAESGFFPAESRIPVTVRSKQHLVCVDFPAVVKNIDKAFTTFDGARGLLKACKDENKRLDVKWRPENIYCKPVFGDRINTSNLLLKVKRRRCTNTDSDDVRYEYKVEIDGLIFITYRFTAMADYQFLPVDKKEDQSVQNLLTEVQLSGTSREEFMSRDVPLFMPPMIFSRIDTSVEYTFRPDKIFAKSLQKGLDHLPPNLIGTGRQKRTLYTIFQNYEDTAPTGPPAAAEEFLAPKLKHTDVHQLVQNLFQERPIWSKNGLRCQLDAKYHPRLKYVLPLVAYYYVNGPWRTLWVRFGYDPKKEKGAKKFQVLDFRLRQRAAAEKLEIGGKRSAFDYNLPTVKARSFVKIPKINTSVLAGDKSKETNSESSARSTYAYDPNVLPPYRQMFYQFCDINVEEIQKLVNVNDGEEETCTEREGWCQADVAEKSREIIFKLVDKRLGRQIPALPIADPGTRRGRSIVNKLRGIMEGPVESDDSDDSDLDADTAEGTVGEEEDDDDEELNEMETEMMDCI